MRLSFGKLPVFLFCLVFALAALSSFASADCSDNSYALSHPAECSTGCNDNNYALTHPLECGQSSSGGASGCNDNAYALSHPSECSGAVGCADNNYALSHPLECGAAVVGCDDNNYALIHQAECGIQSGSNCNNNNYALTHSLECGVAPNNCDGNNYALTHPLECSQGPAVCDVKFLDSYRCSGSDRQREKVKSDCTNEWVKLETCAYGCNAATATCNLQPAVTCEVKFIDNYRCSGNNRQREKQLSDCSKQWVTLETCTFGCQQVWASPTLPVSCALPPSDGGGDGGGSGGGPAPCVPAASCASLGCGKTDSCGTFCGACPAPAPAPAPAPVPVPVPAPSPSPIAIIAVSPVGPANPLQSVALKFPLQPLFMRSASFPDSDCVRPGESALLAVKVQNTGRSTLKDVSFAATVAELGIRASSGPVTLTTTDKQTRFLRLDVPEGADEGSYFLRLTVTNNKLSRTVFRDFVVDSSC